MNQDKLLPPLPTPAYTQVSVRAIVNAHSPSLAVERDLLIKGVDAYTADQMREYALAAIMREEAEPANEGAPGIVGSDDPRTDYIKDIPNVGTQAPAEQEACVTCGRPAISDAEITELAYTHLSYQEESPEASGVIKFARALLERK